MKVKLSEYVNYGQSNSTWGKNENEPKQKNEVGYVKELAMSHKELDEYTKQMSGEVVTYNVHDSRD